MTFWHLKAAFCIKPKEYQQRRTALIRSYRQFLLTHIKRKKVFVRIKIKFKIIEIHKSCAVFLPCFIKKSFLYFFFCPFLYNVFLIILITPLFKTCFHLHTNNQPKNRLSQTHIQFQTHHHQAKQIGYTV